ncbi:unnamed protein product [Phaedon cochleariae]|uniref:Mab-21-like HhH/H2TH-like domain-containing protein n=1 Tax=Phaedon cochleariae TaxID=80249 RepID=A0A9P0GWL4_PHACE|nr:unnamed protein product [Phaedon cochleariae]
MLYLVLDDIDNMRKLQKHQVSYRILNRYIFLTLLLDDLEENSNNPIADMIKWSPLYLSTHVLQLLDKMIPKLQDEKLSNYFFKKANLLVNPGHLSDDDFTIEATNVRNILVRLFDESIMSISGNEGFETLLSAQNSEMMLLYKWRELVEGLLPPPGTRGRRFCFAGAKNKQDIAHTQYTFRQLEYIGLVLNKMLNVKQHILQVDHCISEDTDLAYHQQDHLEDLIFILVTIMDQARDQYLTTQKNPNIIKNRLKIKCNFNNYTSKLVELMRKDKELATLNFEDDLVLVKTILKWLYRGMDQNKKCLGPILRPYLNKIFTASHAASWHIESIKARMNQDELTALGCFAKLVNSGEITPAQGLIDSVNKHWSWAESMLNVVEKNTLRVVFVSERGKVYRHILSLPSYQRNMVEGGSKTLEVRSERREIQRQKTLPNRSYFSSILNEKCKESDTDSIPQHDFLKNSSPLSLVLNKKHRGGEHRGGGDIFSTLASMQKLSVFQEVASSLPPGDRFELAELVQHIQSSKSRKSSTKRWSGTLPKMNEKNRIELKNESSQKYTPKEESAGIQIRKIEADNSVRNSRNRNNALIESCRAARIREDSGVFYLHDSFKIKSLLSKSDSFKYS